MRLFIAEKPSVAAAIARELNPAAERTGHYYDCGEDKVTWCFGHLLSTAEPEDYMEGLERYDIDGSAKNRPRWSIDQLPIFPTEWKMIVNRVPRKGKFPDVEEQKKLNAHVQAIKNLIYKASVVVNAGDPDREGQLVVDELLQFVNCQKKVMRLWLNAVDPASVRKSLQSLEPNSKYKGFMESALGRQRADWLIGMNMTRLYTIIWGSRGGSSDILISVGRVQTPTLAMVVERDKEIAAFKPHDYYSAAFLMHVGEGGSEPLKLKWVRDEAEKEVPIGRVDAEGRIINRAFMEQLVAQLDGREARVSDVVSEEKQEGAPLPYSLSELQKAANKLFGYSPKDVLNGCQALYEKYTLTTYPRTDCGYLKESQHGEAPEVWKAVMANLGSIKANLQSPGCLDMSRKSRAWNDKKVTAHHGIIPTACLKNLNDLPAREKNLYMMIVKRYAAQFLPDYEFMSVSISVNSGTHLLQTKGRVVTQNGWRGIDLWAAGVDGHEQRGPDDDEPTDDAEVANLPEVAVGMTGHLQGGTLGQHKTTPPPRFTGALLIDAMQNIHRRITNPHVRKMLKETEGLGTEATRADTIDTLVKRGYIEERKKGKKVEYHSTAIGQLMVDFIPGIFTSPQLTAYLESRLADIAESKDALDKVEEKIRELVYCAIVDGKNGTNLERLDPAHLPQHIIDAIDKQAKLRMEKQRQAKEKAAQKKMQQSANRNGQKQSA